ncbi:AbrB family transcriptional regulator [Neptunomonas sp. CHC150]|uniref:AbrB family transcriptional regulator n=1 Tax=Neptunomonas sp. CHC150 TaxID=2998324 RepID=UPI0025AF00F5|nr:AbrB family transcriptional regulator [Neptunomonas sp. CHC150]MDN2659518.1 AbrB family transcriptional regulator [Neptunomonas sp. CHC150]
MWLIIRTLFIGVCGSFLAHLVGLPSAWLVGALISVVVVAISGIKVAMPKSTSSMVSLFLGISVALNIEADLIDQLIYWGQSAVLMCGMMAALLAVTYRYYARLPGWKMNEALFCAVPGNLAIMLAMAQNTNANVRRIALTHSVRLLFLVFLVPLFLPLAEREVTLSGFYIEHPEQMIATVFLAVILGWILGKVRVPAAMLVGGIAATLILKLSFGWHWKFPEMMLLTLLVFLGCAIGSRFDGLVLREVIPELKAAMGGLIITLIISGSFAAILHYWNDIPWTQAMLAYAPGGMEVMVAIAMNQEVDALFVATHQMFRMLTMSMVIPVLMFWLDKKRTLM